MNLSNDENKKLLRLLTEKGFAAQPARKLLSSGSPFKEAFDQIIDAHSLFLPSKKPNEFHVDVKKTFDNNQDQVDFRLRFKYAPKTGVISLLTILSKMDDVKRIVLVGENRPFPSAVGIYDTLKKGWIRKRTQHIVPSTGKQNRKKL